jgi:phosphonate transport system substrate-binding protein
MGGRRRARRVAAAGWLLTTCLALFSDVFGDEPALIFGVHPYLPVAELQQRFAPLTRYLGEETGREVVLRIAKDYAEHLQQTGRDSLDIAFLGPAPYVELVAAYGKRPLLTRLEIQGKPFFRGYVIVRQDSPLTGLGDLRGRRFAFGDPGSTMSHLVPRYMLQRAGVALDELFEYRFLGSHANVALGVLTGDFDAGAVKQEVYDQYAPRGLKPLAESPPISEHLFVASRKLPLDTLSALCGALLRLPGDPRGKAILTAIKPGVTGLAPVSDSDYDELRAILRAVAPERLDP